MLFRTLLPAALAVASLVLAPVSAHAEIIPSTPVPWCSATVTTQCIVSAHDGDVPVTEADPLLEVTSTRYVLDGATSFHVGVDRRGGGHLLDPTHAYDVTVNLGSTIAWETFERGHDVQVTRGGSATSQTVTFRMHPARMDYTDSGCGGTGTCPAVGQHLVTGYWEATVDDAGFATDATYRAALRGFDLATNADWVSSPLQMDFATNTITLDVSNAHLEPDGTTPFIGHAQFTLPFSMLLGLYGVDMPTTLTSSAFGVTGASSGTTTSVVVGASEVTVTLEGLTFSKHALRLYGHTFPARPSSLRARRTSRATARIVVGAAMQRGSRIRGYVATCSQGRHVTRGVTRDGIGSAVITVTGLRAGHATCVVRALSRAGRGVARAVLVRA
jgi:hypothetical protein